MYEVCNQPKMHKESEKPKMHKESGQCKMGEENGQCKMNKESEQYEMYTVSDNPMDFQELEELLNKISSTTNHEIHTPIIPKEDVITELTVQKLKIFNFQKRVRTRGMGTELYRSPPHSNIIITNELETLKKRLAVSLEEMNELKKFKLDLIDDYEKKANKIVSNILKLQTEMRNWDELEEHQETFTKLAEIETKRAQERCENLIPKVILAKKVKQMALNFYKKQYLYVHHLNNVSNENINTNEFMTFLESTVLKKDALWKDLQEQIAHYQEVNFGLIKLIQDHYSKWQDLIDTCVKYHNRILKQEHKCEYYKGVLYKTQKITESLKNEKKAVLLGFDNLLNCVFEYFPAKLFADLDKNTFIGKVQCLKQAFAFCKLIQA